MRTVDVDVICELAERVKAGEITPDEAATAAELLATEEEPE